MRIVIVSPAKSGNTTIYKHTANLYQALNEIGGEEIEIVEVVSKNTADGYLVESLSDFINLAEIINQKADVCLLQYHPDAYLGLFGRLILSFVHNLRVPLYTICHAVNNTPCEDEKMVIHGLSAISTRIIAKSHLAIDFLEHFYKINQEQLMLLEYGTPLKDTDLGNNNLAINDSHVIISTGHLRPNNGYETVINALPSILNHYPDTVYLVVGETHPMELNIHGDEYLKSLKLLSKRRGVSDNVIFINQPVTDEEIVNLIKQADIYVSTNVNEHELSDDNLSLAIGTGAVIIATPTWFAQSLLDEQRGITIPFKSSKDLGQTVINTLRSTREIEAYKVAALLYGSQFTWDKIAQRLLKEIKSTNAAGVEVKPKSFLIKPDLLPEWKCNHLLHLVDDTGLLNSSLYDVVDYQSGYGLESNAMAIQMLVIAQEHGVEDSATTSVLHRCLSFVKYMENEDGTWCSEMNYKREKVTKRNSYAEARTVWALGSLYKRASSSGLKDVAYSLLYKLLLQQDKFTAIDAKAAALIGASLVIEDGNPDPELHNLITTFANDIFNTLPEESMGKWQWYEKQITKRFGIVPLALTFACNVTGDKKYLSAARRTCRFVEKLLFSEKVFNPAISGHTSDKAKLVREPDQDSEEAFFMVACYSKLFQITKEPIYLNQLLKTHLWYLGENNLSKSLYDHKEGGCYESLGQRGVNPRKGAKSTCSYWLSHFTCLDAYFLELNAKPK